MGLEECWCGRPRAIGIFDSEVPKGAEIPPGVDAGPIRVHISVPALVSAIDVINERLAIDRGRR